MARWPRMGLRAGALALALMMSPSPGAQAQEATASPAGPAAQARDFLLRAADARDALVMAGLADRLLSGEGLPAPDRAGRDLEILRTFYAGREGRPVWIAHGAPTTGAHRLLAALAASDREGLNPRDYGVTRIGALMERGDSPAALAELELLLTHGGLNLARDLDIGRVEPRRADPELFLERPEPEPQAILRTLAGAPDPGIVLTALAPRRSEYTGLRGALAYHRALARIGGWPTVPAGDTLHPGDRQDRVPLLRRRLLVTGEYVPPAVTPADPSLYDAPLTEAVRRFQQRHGLEVDGVVGANTLAALNVPVEQRIEQISLNMERWRWMPDVLGPSYLLVNLAGFTLELFEWDRPTYSARVVVGTPFQRTPVFSDQMTYLEVNPTWNVPPSIARNEILPKLRRDPSYLARNGYTLLSDWSAQAIPLDASRIDWTRVTPSSFGYKIRQEPGDNNALGRIKFMFPNQFNVYLHDTPSRSLFNRANRTFSHGCIRVQNPFALAERVLALTGTTGWDAARLNEARLTGQRQVIPLAKPLPIHLAYITAFVDETGEMQFRNDIYGRDESLAAALHRSRTPWPAPPDQTADMPAGTAASGGELPADTRTP